MVLQPGHWSHCVCSPSAASWGEGLGIPSPLLGCHQVRGAHPPPLWTSPEASGAGAHRAPVMDVPVITQLMFLQYFEDVEVSQIPSSTECYRFQLFCRVAWTNTSRMPWGTK